jgi:RHS repeat-associated protein
MRILKRTALVLTMAISLAGLQASVTEHQPPAPLPEFKTPEQLAKWRSETAARTGNQESTSSRPSTLDSSTPFYTGKPYLAESSSYAFKYRQYSPEMGRWTTVDPSGFPDGANNRVYAAVPTSELDDNGCQIAGNFSGDVLTAVTAWNVLETAAFAAKPLTYISMTKAEQNGSSWINDTSLNKAIAKSSQVKGGNFDNQVQSWLNNNVSGNGHLNVDMTSLHDNKGDPGHYALTDWDLKTALHGITFSVSGEASGYPDNWLYNSTVSYSKEYTFANHYNDTNISFENWVGVTLQKNGLIHPYQVSGSFSKTWIE